MKISTLILLLVSVGLMGCETMYAIGKGLQEGERMNREAFGSQYDRSPSLYDQQQERNRRYNECLRDYYNRTRNDSMVSVGPNC